MKLLSYMTICLFMLGCATSNVVRETIDDQQAIVKLGTGNIRTGDRVEIFKESCREVYRRSSDATKCSRTQIGQGSVVEIKSEDSAIIKADSGITLEKGLLIETISR